MATVRELKLEGGLPFIGQAIGHPGLDLPDTDVHVLVMARDGRLWLGPLGASAGVPAAWRDCGMVGQWFDDPLDALVHRTWAAYWEAGGE